MPKRERKHMTLRLKITEILRRKFGYEPSNEEVVCGIVCWRARGRADRVTKAPMISHLDCAKTELELLRVAIQHDDPKAQLRVRVEDLLKTVERARGRK